MAMQRLPDEIPKMMMSIGEDPLPKDFVLSLQFRQEEWDKLPIDRRREIVKKFADLWKFMFGCTYEHDPDQEVYDQIVGWV